MHTNSWPAYNTKTPYLGVKEQTEQYDLLQFSVFSLSLSSTVFVFEYNTHTHKHRAHSTICARIDFERLRAISIALCRFSFVATCNVIEMHTLNAISQRCLPTDYKRTLNERFKQWLHYQYGSNK